ncbi:hypothetical protein HDV01_003831 [Terramyces sp. JEL0728]|nr:hypothetical protein HDV01_003831 [Terramyces sp. JEL0728]
MMGLSISFYSITGCVTIFLLLITIPFSVYIIYRLYRGLTANRNLTMFLAATQVLSIIAKIIGFVYFFLLQDYTIFNIAVIIECLLLYSMVLIDLEVTIANQQILQIFSVLNEKITKRKINIMKSAVGVYTSVICAAVVVQAYYGIGNYPAAFGWFIQVGILLLALFSAFYDNAQCIYLAFLIFNSKRNKQDIQSRVVSTVMLNISILLLDWIGLAIYIYTCVAEPPETLYLATQCFVGIHLSSMALVLASLKELTFFGWSVDSKSEKATHTALNVIE